MSVPLNIDWQQILLHLFNFTLLALGLYLLLYKPVKSFMARRAAYYQGLDDAAKETTARAESLESEYRGRLADADAEIGQKRQQAAQAADAAAAEELERAKRQGAELLAQARASADREKEKMLEDVRDEIAQMAVTATEKLMAQSSGQSLDEFLDAVDEK